MFKLAIHVEGGVVQRVEADADVLQKMEVAVLVDNQPARLLRPVIETAVTGYVESVRGAELAHGLTSACHAIAQTFNALGTRDTQDAEAFLRDVEAAMLDARAAIDVAKAKAGWPGHMGRVFEDAEHGPEHLAVQADDRGPPFADVATDPNPQADRVGRAPVSPEVLQAEIDQLQQSAGTIGRRLKLRAM